MQIGCCVPISKYRTAVDAGYDYVEFPAYEVEALTEKEAVLLAEKLKADAIKCERLNSFSLGSPAIVGAAVSRNATERYTSILVERAAILGVKSIGIGAPLARRLPKGFDKGLADRQCEAFLRIAGHIAASYKIDILLEAVQIKMCNYINSTPEALAMVKRVDMEHVGLVVDLYHMETMGESWENLERYVPWTRHMHVSTVGTGTSRGMYDSDRSTECVKAFRAIAASGYNGSVSIEPDYADITPETAKTALGLMRSAWSEALERLMDREKAVPQSILDM